MESQHNTNDPTAPDQNDQQPEHKELDLVGLRAILADKATTLRNAKIELAIDKPTERIRIPNPVAFRADVESQMDATFVDGLLHEAQGQPGLFVETAQPGNFGFCPEDELEKEAGEIAKRLMDVVRSIDPSKEALALLGAEVPITDDQPTGGRKLRKPFRLVKLNLSRSSVQRTGIVLDLTPTSAKDDVVEATA